MKRKIALIVTLVLVVTMVGVSTAFAQGSNDTNGNSFFKSMFDNMRNWVQQAEEKGQITKDQAESWNKHVNDMEKYHEQSGNSGPCGNVSNGAAKPGNQSYSPGYGKGMMGSFGGGMMSGFVKE